jgi:predicted exporter
MTTVTARTWMAMGALLLVALGLAYALTRITIDSDYSAFLPAGASDTQRAFMRELRDGVASRIVLVEISGPAPESVAEASRKLAPALAASPAFRYVTNGATAFGQRELALLGRHRYVLSDAVEVPGHFARDGLRAALEQRLDALAGSAAFLDKQFLANDPTGEMRRLLQRMTPAATPQRLHGVWFDASGTRALLLAETRASGADLAGQQAAMTALRDAFAAIQPGAAVTMSYSSPGAMAVAGRTLVAADARTLSIAALVLVLAILAWVYRSVPVVLLCFMPAAAGLLAGVIAVNAWFGSVHGIALAFGVTLLGEAVDYPSYLLTQIRGDTPIAVVKDKFGKTLRLAVLTTACGALALVASGFPGLAQLGVLTMVGVLVAGAATWWLLPHWIPRTGPPRLRSDVLRGGRHSPARRAGCGGWWCCARAAVLGVLTANRPWWDDDLATMNPLPASFKERDLRLRAAIGAPDVRTMLLVSGATRDDVLRASESLRPVLEQWRADGTIGGFELVSDYLPSEATQARRRAALPAGADLRQNLTAALSGLPFRPATFEPFLKDVEDARSGPSLTPADYAGSALGLKVESLLRNDGGQWHVVVPLAGVKDAAALQAAQVLRGAQARLLDLRAESIAMMAAYRQQAVASSLAGMALIGVLLVVGLSSVRRAVRVFVPVLLAVAGTAAILVAAGTPMTVFHFVALLLTLGIGVNYALVIERAAMRDAAPDVWRTLAVVSATALCTFGLLAWSSAPVLRAIGVTVCLGVVLSLVLGALLIQDVAAREREGTHP